MYNAVRESGASVNTEVLHNTGGIAIHVRKNNYEGVGRMRDTHMTMYMVLLAWYKTKINNSCKHSF